MAKCAEYHLFCGCGFEASIAATKTFTAQMMILGVMAAVWGENDALLEEMRGVGAKAGELIDTKFGDIEILAKKYQNIPGAVIL